VGVELDHALVPSRDRRAAAELLASLLDVPWAESAVGPFCPVYVNDGLTLDFDQADGPFPVLHYCFRVSEAEFDGKGGIHFAPVAIHPRWLGWRVREPGYRDTGQDRSGRPAA
jgi:hypothetical protein